MTTKYILHGGSAQHVNEANDKFFKEILKNTPSTVKILLIHFAGLEERGKLNYQKDTSQFLRNSGHKKLVFTLATKDKFITQIKDSDVVYIGGGTTVRLMDTLIKYKKLKESFSGKVIAGESAGANCLSTYCYSKSGGGFIKCLGILPIIMCPHYDQVSELNFESVPENLEKVLLNNYQFKVFNKR